MDISIFRIIPIFALMFLLNPSVSLGSITALNTTALYQEISENKIIPDNISLRYAEYIHNRTTTFAPLYILCGLSLELLTSNRLTSLLAVSPSIFGVGMALTLLTSGCGGNNTMVNNYDLVNIPGCIVKSYSDRPHIYDLFMSEQPEYFYDTITLCDYELYAQFQYTGNTISSHGMRNTLVVGPTKLYKDKKLIHQT